MPAKRLRLCCSAGCASDLLEAEGIIGPADGARPREILIGSDSPQAEGYGMEPDEAEPPDEEAPVERY